MSDPSQADQQAAAAHGAEDALALPDGAGSLCAEVVSDAARLVERAARRSLGWEGSEEAAERAAELSARAAKLAEDLAEAYVEAREALDAARIAADSSHERDLRLGAALARAAELPLAVAQAGADLAELAAEGAESADHDVRADSVAAAHLASAAAQAAAHLVRINLTVQRGDEVDVEALASTERAQRALARAQSATLA